MSIIDDLTTQQILDCTGKHGIASVQKIQTLWSGYGQILRVTLTGQREGAIAEPTSVIVKMVRVPSGDQAQAHPRGWNTNQSHQRKHRSYQVESNWYRHWSPRTFHQCRMAKTLWIDGDEGNHTFVLEDLDAAGFPKRIENPSMQIVRVGLRWLARFHALHLGRSPDGLWRRGCYWHLETRPDELRAMPEDHPLRIHAAAIDERLQNCPYQTIVHGDAKIANFCFREDAADLAAVDFQYVGGGCGMSDVAYFLGSCLMDDEIESREIELLDLYFEALGAAMDEFGRDDVKLADLRANWTAMFPVAWADFNRFLIGWCPGHEKLTAYGRSMTLRALSA